MTRLRLTTAAGAVIAALSVIAPPLAPSHADAPVAQFQCVSVGPVGYNGLQVLPQLGACVPTP